MNNPSFGVNLGVIAPWSSNQPFLDYFKQSEWYIFNPREDWFTRKNDAQLDLDAQGWLKSLPTVQGTEQPVMAAVLWNKWHPPGKYVIEYKGKGELSTDFTPVESKQGRLVVELKDNQNRAEQLQIYIDSTDPKGTGDYIRDIKVYRLEDEPLVKSGELYRPEFLDKVSRFRTFRYMDWLTTNFSAVTDWNPTEQKSSKARYFDQVPYEAIANLANQTKTDVWINIPHLASNQFIQQAARYLKKNVDPSLRIYVEYSNEHFTDGFDQFQYFINQGKQRWGNTIQNPGEQFYGARAAEVSQIFGQEFGRDKKQRLFPVLTFQASDRDVSSVLEAPASVRAGNIAPKDAGFRVYSVDTYFGFEYGDPTNFATLRRWMKEPDRGIAKIRRAIETGEGLPLSYSPIKDLKTDYAFHRKLAQELGWEYTSYEGGSGITTQDFVDENEDEINDNQDIVDYLTFLNRHPVIKEAYQKLYGAWQNNGGDLAIHYADIGFPDWYGSWGLYESVYNEEGQRSPRADYIYDQNEQPPLNWDDARSGSTFENGRLFRGSNQADQLSGSKLGDRLYGLSGRDRLQGKDGNDFLLGGDGADTLDGGKGKDTVSYRLSVQGVQVDLATGRGKKGEAEGDQLREIEVVLGSLKDDQLTGDSRRNILIGNAGRDRLIGQGGNDRLFGKGDRDILAGSRGNDFIDGGAGSDRLSGNSGQDVFRLAKLSESQFDGYDQILDFQIGSDQLRGPRSLAKEKITQLGTLSSLNMRDIKNLLTSERFQSNQGATFRVGPKTFLAINDNISGFQASQDALIEITGYSGNLSQLNIKGR